MATPSARSPVSILGALVFIGVAMLLLSLAYSQAHGGEIYPGVRLMGTEIGGMTPEEASGVIASTLPAPSTPVLLRDPGDLTDPADDRSWRVARGDLGLAFDPLRLADLAYEQGRTGLSLLAPIWIRVRGRELAPTGMIDMAAATAALQRLAPQVDVPPVEGDILLEDGQLIISQPRNGRQLDVEMTLAALAERATGQTFDELDLVTIGTAPRFADVTAVAEAYEMVVSGPVRLTWRQGQRFSVERATVAAWVTIRPTANPQGDMVPSIVFDEEAIAEWVAGLASDVNREARDARLSYDELTGEISVLEPSQDGQLLDVEGSVQSFISAAYTDGRTAELAVETQPAKVRSEVADKLQGTARVLVHSSTRLDGQPDGREVNIVLAASKVDGVTLAPGVEYSFIEALGAVGPESGFHMAQVESAGRGVLAGGIEQVATGIFRAAVWTGLVVTERHAGETRDAWVEPPIGLDASVSVPSGDLRFVNDTDGYLVFGCRVDAGRKALVTSVVGAPPARIVQLAGPVVRNLAAPLPAVSRLDERLQPGESQQSQWARHGAEVAYQRTVIDAVSGAERFQDAFVSRYRPSADLTLVGPMR